MINVLTYIFCSKFESYKYWIDIIQNLREWFEPLISEILQSIVLLINEEEENIVNVAFTSNKFYTYEGFINTNWKKQEYIAPFKYKKSFIET